MTDGELTSLIERLRTWKMPNGRSMSGGELMPVTATAADEIDRLRKALIRHGDHDIDCAYFHVRISKDHNCTCGFDAAIGSETNTV